MLKLTHSLYVKFGVHTCLDTPRDPRPKRQRVGAYSSRLFPIDRRAALAAWLMVAAISVGQARAQIGACCLGNGNCVETNPAGCGSLGGEFMGAGTSCATATCTGACCLSDLSCIQVSRDECTDGAFRGAGSTCATHCPGAVGTGFSYQGRLDRSGTPVNASADLEFRLFVSAIGDPQVGPTVTVSDVSIVDGLFTTQIDFGNPDFFVGIALWLEVAVRSPAGSGAFTTLTPRQPLTAAPFALNVPIVHSLQAPDGTPRDALRVDNDGNVGIGITTPRGKFEVVSGNGSFVQIDNLNGDIHVNGGNDGAFGIFNDSGIFGRTEILGGGASRLVITNAGRVGIGTTSPVSALEVRGDIRFGSSGQLRAAGSDEGLRIIRGNVNGSAQILAGSGFSIAQTGTGRYRITFDTPFSDVPTVTASAIPNDLRPHVVTVAAAAAFADVRVHEIGFGDNFYPFNFIAVGPR
jgi:hypothetical protein